MELSEEKFEQFIQNLATKEDVKEFVTKEDLKAETDKILTAIDGLAKQVKTTNDELPAIQRQLRDMNDWILEAANKIGVEYKG